MAIILCALSAWTIMVLLFWSVWTTLEKGIIFLWRLHQIPCHKCEFFTNDYRLKCTVHPKKACSEQAISCLDFEPKTAACNACQSGRIWKLDKNG
ncbi:hypothetical protein BCD64_06465 [Nostoc sp. MBR 210]|uniref:hypothetical protein n=1 Tax=Nostoc sp. FACHB-280 TaxID=2692839 RepID=UPI00081EAC03|nr:hypothetical protein [Nostoc sp. FACHB-280]MBD2494922.1 hypothetical protein [Nostoc sp. FACHB-280]OCQ97735.1 hypothetical protein BCD64_06465 [Nostoc sp. MBR 210]